MKLPVLDAPRGSSRPIMDDTVWWQTPDDFPTPDQLNINDKKAALMREDNNDTNV